MMVHSTLLKTFRTSYIQNSDFPSQVLLIEGRMYFLIDYILSRLRQTWPTMSILLQRDVWIVMQGRRQTMNSRHRFCSGFSTKMTLTPKAWKKLVFIAYKLFSALEVLLLLGGNPQVCMTPRTAGFRKVPLSVLSSNPSDRTNDTCF